MKSHPLSTNLRPFAPVSMQASAPPVPSYRELSLQDLATAVAIALLLGMVTCFGLSYVWTGSLLMAVGFLGGVRLRRRETFRLRQFAAANPVARRCLYRVMAWTALWRAVFWAGVLLIVLEAVGIDLGNPRTLGLR
jgi:hypothetical protein